MVWQQFGEVFSLAAFSRKQISSRLACAFLLLFLHAAAAFAQLSPGPLSKGHSGLEGTLQCVKCHSLGSGRAQLKCSSCHADIAERVQSNRGYHARIVDRTKGDTGCARCHAEHAGRDAALIRWPVSQASFDHAETGHRLEGKHSLLQCGQCHKTQSFLGLKTACLACHQDTHRGQLGATCTTCHSQDSWKAVSKFNHRTTRFPLTGLHTSVACERCHIPAQSGAVTRYRDVAFSTCASCHRDPHAGAFLAPCSQCHTTNGWKTSTAALSANFDHGRTAYPLIGRHTGLQCRSCHTTSNFNDTIANGRCTDCHTDKHAGQFAHLRDRGDCVSCHNVNGFKPTTFTAVSHSRSRYPLLGKHAAVSCEKCHPSKGEATSYYPQAQSCVNCHRDVHAGQFKQRYSDKCESCHKVEGFSPSTFTLARHSEARFALAGAHGAIACVDCHTRDRGQDAHRYRFADVICASCHSDPHGFAEKGKTCEICHTDRAWKPSKPFDHSITKFPLLGQHRTASCTGCHSQQVGFGKPLSFRDTPQTCSSCHEDIHAAQFSKRPGGADCATCHQPVAWKPAVFDHNDTAYPLDGRHRAVFCADCHRQRTEVRGRPTLIYREAPKECARCH